MIGRGLLITTWLILTVPSGSAAMEFGPERPRAVPSEAKPRPLTSKSSSGIAGTMRWGPSSIRSTTSATEYPPRSTPGSRTLRRNTRLTSFWFAMSISSV